MIIEKFGKMNKKYQIFSICLLTGISIIIYGYYRCLNPTFEDPLVYGKNICRVCDLWSIGHLLFNMMLGFFYPKHGVFIFTLGLLWETFEFLVHKEYLKDIPILSSINNLSKCKASSLLSSKEQHWVYYELTDIPMNIIGILSGIYLNKTYQK